MPLLSTSHFGSIPFEPESIFEFPRGLPGFEARRSFVPVQLPQAAPLLFLQSLDDPALCFPALPIGTVDPSYRLSIIEEDLTLLGLPHGRQPRIGVEVLCLAVLSLREDGSTANLRAPVVVNLQTHRAVQCIAPEGSYSHRHPLFQQEDVPC